MLDKKRSFTITIWRTGTTERRITVNYTLRALVGYLGRQCLVAFWLLFLGFYCATLWHFIKYQDTFSGITWLGMTIVFNRGKQ